MSRNRGVPLSDVCLPSFLILASLVPYITGFIPGFLGWHALLKGAGSIAVAFEGSGSKMKGTLCHPRRS